MELLTDKLKSFEYYKNKLPLYLQNSFGLVEQFKIWHTILLESVDTSEKILSLLNIFDDNYLEYIESFDFPPITAEDTKFDILEKLASLFGYGREIKVTYINEQATLVTENILLNNMELLLLIKAQIVKNYYDGSREELTKLYNEILKLPIVYITGSNSNTCDIYFIGQPEGSWGYWGYTENIGKMYLSGLLTVHSMGIKYTLSVYTQGDLLYWRNYYEPDQYGWGGIGVSTGGKWSL